MKPPSLPQEAEQALIEGRKIEAIKAVRLAEGLGLKLAKERVEAAQRAHPERYPKSGNASVGWVGLLALASLGWILWKWLGS